MELPRPASAPDHAAVPPTWQRVVTCFALVLFGTFLLYGLRRSAAPANLPAPDHATAKVPERRLRFAWVDAAATHISNGPMMERLASLRPDYLFVEHIEQPDVAPLAAAVHMQQSYIAQLFGPLQVAGDGQSTSGTCLLSKYPLYDAGPLRSPVGIFGVHAVSVIDGDKFLLACVSARSERNGGEDDLASLIEFWRNSGSLPIVAAGTFGRGFGEGRLVQGNTGWFDGFTPFVRILPPGSAVATTTAPRGRVLFSTGWSCVAGGIEELATRGTREPVCGWVDAAAARSVGTTTSKSMPADVDEP